MWWRLYADHWPPLGGDAELICIDVDVVDGHIATVADERELAEWQQELPLPWPATPEEPQPRRPELPRRANHLDHP
jgi:hypothetical protein